MQILDVVGNSLSCSSIAGKYSISKGQVSKIKSKESRTREDVKDARKLDLKKNIHSC